jgi:ribosomal protein S27E
MKHRSACCNAPLVVAGKGVTHWYECEKCGKTTDLVNRTKPWNKCDWCGRFISLADFDSGKATRKLLYHDTAFSHESYKNKCASCNRTTIKSERKHDKR